MIQLQHLIEQLKNLNFYGDSDIDTILTLLHSMIARPAKERNITEITRQLRAIGTLTRGTLLTLGEQPRDGRDIPAQEIGIIPTPTDEDVREARFEILHAVQYATFPDMPIREERETDEATSLEREAR